MKHGTITIAVGLAVLLAVVPAARAETPSVLLEKGIYTEETLGDPSSAIGIYEQVISDAEADRRDAAEAQFRLANCHMKLKQDTEARAAFKALLSKYGDLEDLADKARPLLESLLDFDPASLMPPDTLMYAEIGSPGRQLEKILNMLKGTPLANPLGMMGGGGAATQPANGSQQSARTPMHMVGALLNPSMLKELKKLRSMAVGITGIGPNGQPSFVAVLRPGESDAVRGLLTAAVLGAGQPMEPVHDMQAVVIERQVACAFDEDVFIVAMPPDRLAWSVGQYKLHEPQPSLLTENASFARFAPAAGRKGDVLTVWGNPAKAYALAQELVPPQDMFGMRMANSFMDFENMEGAVARLRLSETSLVAEANLAYRQGHHSVVLDMARTPPLDQTAFAAVPANAVGVAAVALLGPNDPAAGAIAAVGAQAIDRVTGLDLGRELFSNIQQITVFLMPPSEAVMAHPLYREAPPLPALGVAIKSRSPAHTLAVLDALLSIPHRAAAAERGEAVEQDRTGRRRYVLGTQGRDELAVHLAQEGDTTVVALLPEVIDASLAGLASGDNAPATGPLSQALHEAGGKSKLVLVSAGGLVRWLDAAVVGRDQSETDSEGKPIGEQLAAALDDMSIRLETTEQPNAITARFEIANIPPMADVFPLAMRFGQEIESRFARAATPARPKMLLRTARKFVGALAKGKDIHITELIMPGSPAEAKVAGIRQTHDLTAFNTRDDLMRRVGNEGLVLATATDDPAPTRALVVHLRMKDDGAWRVVDLDSLPMDEAKQRLTQFGEQPSAVPAAPEPSPVAPE